MKTSLMFPVVLMAMASVAACSGEGVDPRSDQGDIAANPPAERAQAVISPAITPDGAAADQSPHVPLGAGQYRVALVWGKLHGDRTPSVVNERWDIDVSSLWGTVSVVATLPGESGIKPTAIKHSNGHVEVGSDENGGAQGVILSVVVPGIEPPLLMIHQANTDHGTKVDLASIDETPGGTMTLGHGGKLTWTGFTVAPCPRGFTLGLWGPGDSNSPSHGALFGELTSAEGARLGWMDGTWTAGRANAPGSFKAEYFDVDGSKQGAIGGDFGPGTFQGNWKTHSAHQGGFLHGVLGGNDRAGGWLGTWSAICGI